MIAAADDVKPVVPACTLALLNISAKYNIRRGSKSASIQPGQKKTEILDDDRGVMEKAPISKGRKVILHLVRHGEVSILSTAQS